MPLQHSPKGRKGAPLALTDEDREVLLSYLPTPKNGVDCIYEDSEVAQMTADQHTTLQVLLADMAGKPFTMPSSVSALLKKGFNAELLEGEGSSSPATPSASPSANLVGVSQDNSKSALSAMDYSPAISQTTSSRNVSARRGQGTPMTFRENIPTEASDSSSETVGMTRRLQPAVVLCSDDDEKPSIGATATAETDFSDSIHLTDAELALILSNRKGKRVVRDALVAAVPSLGIVDDNTAPPQRVNYTRVGVTPRPVAALTARVDDLALHQPVVTNPAAPATVHLEMRPLKISESLERSKLAKFDGTKVHDVSIYYAKFATEMRIRCAHPDIWHRVAFLWLSGTAMSALQSALSSNEEPQTFAAFVLFMKSRFPSTVSAATVDEEGDTLRQGAGESVSTFWSRFQAWMIKADTVKLSYQPDLMFVKKLRNNDLHSHIRSETARYSLAGQALTLDEIAHLAMEWDNRPNRSRDTVSQVSDSTIPRQDNRNRSRKRQASSFQHRQTSTAPRPRQQNDGCYNCGQVGHIFGNIDNPTCPQAVSEATKAYFANKRSNASRPAHASGGGSGSQQGSSKA